MPNVLKYKVHSFWYKVSVIFFTSWFPLNTLNMVMDIFGSQLEAVTKEVMMTMMMVMEALTN